MPEPLITPHTIARFCEQRGLALSKFGREALGDPRLYSDLRAGRELRPQTLARIIRFMEASNG